jgi:hypothetical protein
MINSRFGLLLGCFLILISVSAQSKGKFIESGEPIASFPIHFRSGFLFAEIPTEDTDVYGKKVVVARDYMFDVGVSNDGMYVPLDSENLAVVTSSTEFLFPVSVNRKLSVQLVPNETRDYFHQIDSAFFGVLGYAFLKRYITVFDFRERKVELYSAASEVTYTPLADTGSTKTELLDDAMINYCHCQFPSIWVGVKAPPVKEGRVHLTLESNQSSIFRDALDEKTLAIVDKGIHEDSVSGKNNFGGIQLGQFIVGGRNIAGRNPKRTVITRPIRYNDLSISVVGTLAMDVLRTYQAFIIDPVRSELRLVR